MEYRLAQLMARMSSAGTGFCLITRCAARRMACHQSSGRCSIPPLQEEGLDLLEFAGQDFPARRNQSHFWAGRAQVYCQNVFLVEHFDLLDRSLIKIGAFYADHDLPPKAYPAMLSIIHEATFSVRS
ncbi:MAG: hypothetical protein C0393_08305 [Anaerolinea sp.]|nr:hypothetical protein [Anaerolinea sp.]